MRRFARVWDADNQERPDEPNVEAVELSSSNNMLEPARRLAWNAERTAHAMADEIWEKLHAEDPCAGFDVMVEMPGGDTYKVRIHVQHEPVFHAEVSYRTDERSGEP